MDKNKILDYVMKTPYNTNIAILDSMIMSLLAENKIADSAESLSNALAEGKDVILTADVETTSPIVVKAESKLDLNKKSIKAQDNSSEYYIIKAEGEGAVVTISGNGIISAGASQQAIPVTAANGGKVIIKDGTYDVKEVFKGNTTFSEGFSTLLKTPTLTVGTPIRSGNKIIGALLLHSKIEGMNEGISQGFKILSISILVALVLSILLSIALAINFTKPLKRMRYSAIQLANGDYTVKTNIKQKDEIGELASTIDVLSEQLEIASNESKKLLKLRQDFVANISHELRTPVTVIRGSLEALCDGIITDPEQIKNYNYQMLNESIFLQRLVNDLLDLSRLQNIDFKIEKQELNLLDVIDDIVRSTKNIAKLKNITIVQEQDNPVFIITGDYGRLRQMFLTILDNAIKFSPKEEIIKISLKDKIVSIKDNGIGISKDDLPYIFDRFYKIKSEENKNGTGLGLAIAKQIAERHNITLSVSSKENEFTEFRFKF